MLATNGSAPHAHTAPPPAMQPESPKPAENKVAAESLTAPRLPESDGTEERFGFLTLPTFDGLTKYANQFMPKMPTANDLYEVGMKLMTANGQGWMAYSQSYSNTLLRTANPLLAHMAGLGSAIASHTQAMR